MTSAFAPFVDVNDVIRQNLLRQQQQLQQSADRRNTIGAPVNIPSNRNFSIGNFTPVTGNNAVMDNLNGLNEHIKLDKSHSEPCDRVSLNNNTNLNNQQPKQQVQQQQQQQQQQQVNSSRYKTELCRPFEENGHCKYADKCQFAHGMHELKQLQRHPKYKTELCRTFHSKGFCPYGPRCNFIHNEDVNNKLNDKNNRITAQIQQSTQQQPYFQHISPPLSQSPPPPIRRPTSISFNSSFNGSLGSSAESSPPASVGTGSPSLSPVTVFGEDGLVNSGLNMPMNNTLNFDNSTNGNVFNASLDAVPSHDLAPLNIQTHPDFIQQFSALLNLNNQTQNVSSFEEWDSTNMFAAPPSPQDSISGESVGSASSFATTSNTVSMCGSPVESGKNFRLPVFNHISQD